MTIVRLNKVTLIGPLSGKDEALARLQEQGCLHLTSLSPAPKEPEKAPPPHAERAYKALRFLTSTPRKRRVISRSDNFDVQRIVDQVLDNQQQLREAGDQRDFLLQRIKNLEPWGDFQLPDKEALLGHKLWFYILPVNQIKRLRQIEIPWAIVHRDNRHAFLVLVSRTEPPSDILPVPRIHTGARSLNELRIKLEEVEITLEELTAQREALTRWLFLLQQNLHRAEDQAAMEFAKTRTLDQCGLFAVQGWLPRHETGQFEAFAIEQGMALAIEQPDEHDRPPTLYNNPQQVSGGQDLVDFYQTPGYRSWDPSTVVFFSFSLFFAMILADAGYALLLGLILAWRWKAMGESGSGRRLRLLSAVVIGFSVAYGALVGSFFGVTPKDGTLLAAAHLLDLNNFDLMMKLSILIGAVHVALANGLIAYNSRQWRYAMPPAGWIAVIIGGLVLWLGTGVVLVETVGWTLFGLGLFLILLFSDPSPLRFGVAKLGKRLVNGLISLTNLTKIFGDVLSYMRLFALGLASASLALTFNQLADQVEQALPGLGFFLSLLILILGHTLNLALSVMSGVVHGLRLNFIEFFNWGISEEGYPFKPFLKKEKRHG